MNKENKQAPDNILRLMYRAPYGSIIMLARFKEIIKKPDLQQALSLARIKYPLLNARFSQDEDGNIETLSDYKKDFSIYCGVKTQATDWLALAWSQQQKPFDMQKGPLIKFILLSDETTSDLVIICHHCICDGLSLVYLIKDLVYFMENPATQVQAKEPPPRISLDNLATEKPASFVNFFTALLANSLNRSWNKNKVVFSQTDFEKMNSDYWQGKDIGLLDITLTAQQTAAIIASCKQNKVTVNSALTTAFTLAQKDLFGDKKGYLRRALLAISARELLKTAQSDNFGQLAIGNVVTLPRGKGDFWSLAASFNAKTKAMLANPKKFLALIAPLDFIEPTLFDAIYFVENAGFKNSAAERFKKLVLSPNGKPRRSMDITNLGAIKDCDEKIETIYFVPMLSSNYVKTLGIVTVHDAMNIIIMHNHEYVSHEKAEEFRQKIITYLKNACSDFNQ